MATLNITYNGLSQDVPIELATDVSNADLQRIAVEVLQGQGVQTTPDMFDDFVVDRMSNGDRLYLRPKVPFGSMP